MPINAPPAAPTLLTSAKPGPPPRTGFQPVPHAVQSFEAHHSLGGQQASLISHSYMLRITPMVCYNWLYIGGATSSDAGTAWCLHLHSSTRPQCGAVTLHYATTATRQSVSASPAPSHR